MEAYLSIKKTGNFKIFIKKSQFICHVKRTNNQKEAEDFIAQVKKENFSANHNCFAYVLGMHDEIVKQNDNGEPSGTAGAPILNVLRQLGLHNVTAVVTRYFGGIKLGAGGLIRAYSNVTSQTIEHLGMVSMIPQTEIAVSIAYPLQGKLEHFLETKHILTIATNYTEKVTITIALESSSCQKTLQTIYDLLNSQVSFKKGAEVYHEFPYQKNQKTRY